MSDAPRELAFDDLEVGMSVTENLSWSQAELDAFRALTGDDAPVHHDADFARDVGMPGPIVYGLLTVSPFSRLLGCRLPGALSVIQSLRFDFAQPVAPGEALRYEVAVSQLSPGSRSAVLALSVTRDDGTQVVRGRAQCGLAR
jgi:3-hydroxybutyryl-CoA dehydratase